MVEMIVLGAFCAGGTIFMLYALINFRRELRKNRKADLQGHITYSRRL
jgi:glutamate/tyrosine decarboxylase-like PLP-dependent enzyme